MSCCSVKNLLYFSVIVLLLGVSIAYYRQYSLDSIASELVKWGEANKITIDKAKVKPSPFKVEFDQNEWDLLVKKLEISRYFEPLDDKIVPKFEYGFDPRYAKKLADHWRTKFDWKKQVERLNKLPQFRISINGTTIHYVHVKTNANKNLKAIPVILVDGWPGSFYGFYKMIQYIEDNFKDLSLDIVVPSIPGYHFSTPLTKPIDTADTAILFDALMRFVHGENVQYHAHGEDWGAIVITIMAQLYPNRVKSLHLTMAPPTDGLYAKLYQIFGPFLQPSFYTEKEVSTGMVERSSFKHILSVFLKEFGYLHLQATWPDSVGHGLTDSPVGLLAYILEKYSGWSFNFAKDISGSNDGGLEKFNTEDLLTITTLYWMSNSITSSMRFYKNYFSRVVGGDWPKNVISSGVVSANVSVGYQYFQNDLIFTPRSLVAMKYANLVQLEIVEGGGHFAALQNPKATADDLIKLIKST